MNPRFRIATAATLAIALSVPLCASVATTAAATPVSASDSGRYGALIGAGALDPTFGVAGTVLDRVDAEDGSSMAFGYAHIAEASGKSTVAGEFDAGYLDVIIARHNADGTPDETFGKQGMTQIRLTDRYFHVYDLVQVPSGDYRMIGDVAVEARGERVSPVPAVMAITQAGELDESFGTGGVAELTAPGFPAGIARAAVSEADGSIVVGLEGKGGASRSFLTRIDARGAVDHTMGDGGAVTLFGGQPVAVSAVVSADGRLVVGGTTFRGSAGDELQAVVTRMDNQGRTDASFGHEGVAGVSQSNSNVLASLAVDGQGRIVGAGVASPSADTHVDDGFGAFRLTADGQLDRQFGGDGTVEAKLSPEAADVPRSVGIAPDGRIVLSGTRYKLFTPDAPMSARGSGTERGGHVPVRSTTEPTDGSMEFLQGDGVEVLRLNTDGSPDASFGTGGKVVSQIGSTYQLAFDGAVRSDGSVEVAGWFNVENDFMMSTQRFLG